MSGSLSCVFGLLFSGLGWNEMHIEFTVTSVTRGQVDSSRRSLQDQPFKINGVPLSGVNVHKFDDKYFSKDAKKPQQKWTLMLINLMTSSFSSMPKRRKQRVSIGSSTKVDVYGFQGFQGEGLNKSGLLWF
ncbi:unnamed protein product [Sphenostylis stenocarpa]|uniref:Uncharacterized protein n=1 Tax=Sphenostylis stenocarpa TaxID=92480 RepID=A0AA86S9G8_9FABA|nr:unnamed protein product [Sphenostylis stenocarpa]